MKATREIDTRDDLAPLLRAARAYAGVGQQEVAERLGVSRQTVSVWERGATPVPPVARAGVIQGLLDLGAPESFFAGRGEW